MNNGVEKRADEGGSNDPEAWEAQRAGLVVESEQAGRQVDGERREQAGLHRKLWGTGTNERV